MNKAELAMKIAERLNIQKKQAEDFIEAFEAITTATLAEGGEVTIAGFGTFSARTRAGRIGVNPQDPKEQITIPPVFVPKFKAGKALKDTLKAAGKSRGIGSASAPLPTPPSGGASGTPSPL
ncbi:HU family DNA-binding protein [Candidatus Uhrbacteria bacterium]|nr:HU family DNA-binding protein [Candidatus Uhrbacteria bacterium]